MNGKLQRERKKKAFKYRRQGGRGRNVNRDEIAEKAGGSSAARDS